MALCEAVRSKIQHEDSLTDNHRVRHCNNPWALVAAITPLLVIRVMRAWNQTGQKQAGEPDIVKGFLHGHYYVLWILVCMSYSVTAAKMLSNSQGLTERSASLVLTMLLCLGGFAFKVAFTMADAPELLGMLPMAQHRTQTSLDLTTQARALFSGMLIFCLGNYPSGQRRSSYTRSDRGSAIQNNMIETWTQIVTARLEALHGVLTLFLMTQSRITSIPLFALLELQTRALAWMELSPTEISLTSIVLQYASFFAFGGSNAISSIDLSNGYNGVNGYNAAMVGILTFCSNWAGPIWWTFATMILVRRCRRGWQSSLNQLCQLSTCFLASNVLFVMLACTALRTHLFIWTVFSPKYLYLLAWSFGQHLCISMFSLSLFRWLDSH